MSTPPTAPRRKDWLFWTVVAVIALGGIFARVYPSAAFHVGPDELFYRRYALTLDKAGLTKYPAVAANYLERLQQPGATVELPPTRVLYIVSGLAWKKVRFGNAEPLNLRDAGFTWHDPMLVSLRQVAALATILHMFAAGALAWRLAGRAAGLAVFALAAASPLMIHMSQHAFIDGFFALWSAVALWGLWESLRQPHDWRWLGLYGLALAALVLTKENAFFVYVALMAIIALNRWCGFGEVRRPLLIVSVAAPAGAMAVLLVASGGVSTFVHVLQTFASMVRVQPYAIENCDGPWHRYFIDLLILSPFVFVLALGAAFGVTRHGRGALYLLVFAGVSYLVMCNLKYGLNLRYATIWDLPLRFLAATQLARIVAKWPRHRWALSVAAVVFLCGYDLRQYKTFFMDTNVYELATPELLRAEKMLKLDPES